MRHPFGITDHVVRRFRERAGPVVFNPRYRRMSDLAFMDDRQIRAIIAEELHRSRPLTAAERRFIAPMVAQRHGMTADQEEMIFDDHIYILTSGTIVRTFLCVDDGMLRNLDLNPQTWRICVDEPFADVLLARKRLGNHAHSRDQVEDLVRKVIAEGRIVHPMIVPPGAVFSHAAPIGDRLYYRTRLHDVGLTTFVLRYDPEIDGAWLIGVAAGATAHRKILPVPPADASMLLEGRILEFPMEGGPFRGHVHEVLGGLQRTYGPGTYQRLQLLTRNARPLPHGEARSIFSGAGERTIAFTVPLPQEVRDRARAFPANDLVFLFARKNPFATEGGVKSCVGIFQEVA